MSDSCVKISNVNISKRKIKKQASFFALNR